MPLIARKQTTATRGTLATLKAYGFGKLLPTTPRGGGVSNSAIDRSLFFSSFFDRVPSHHIKFRSCFITFQSLALIFANTLGVILNIDNKTTPRGKGRSTLRGGNFVRLRCERGRWRVWCCVKHAAEQWEAYLLQTRLHFRSNAFVCVKHAANGVKNVARCATRVDAFWG